MKQRWRAQKAWILGTAGVLLLLIGGLAVRYLLPRPVLEDVEEVQRISAEYWDEEVVLTKAAEGEILNLLAGEKCTRALQFKGFFFPEDRRVEIRLDLELGGVIDLYLGDDSVVQMWGGREGYYRLPNARELEERLTAVLLPLLPETEQST